jgi:very-short-patch-repair endonuclease
MPFPRKSTLIRARRLREESTPAEQALWEWLRDRQFMGLKFRRQFPIGPYVADFYCHSLKLVVELDGGIHEANLGALGYSVLRFTNQQILESPQTALAEIARFAESLSADPVSPSSPSGRGGSGR